jgi:uncharacterized protein/tRNA (cytidine56-2'-O)-methyltransferase
MLTNIDADRDLVIAGALLHDIGRSVDHSVLHAYIGSQIVLRNGLSFELAEIVRKHTGAGLDALDVQEMGLPEGDYIPKTIEEKIVAHADNLVSDNRVVAHDHSVSKLVAKGAYRGAERIEALHMELSDLYGEDLDCIPGIIGEYPKLMKLPKGLDLRGAVLLNPFHIHLFRVIQMVTELNESNFDSFVEQNKIALVDCWAPWCGPCRRMGPIIEEVAEEMKGKAGVAKLNTDENQAIAVRFNINAIPTLLVFKDNVLVETLVGLRPKEDVVDYLNSLL